MSHGTARPDENIVNFDQSCDRSIVGMEQKILTPCNCDDEAETVGGRLAQMPSTKLPLALAAGKIAHNGSKPLSIIAVHQALHNDNPQQNKNMLNSNAMHLHGVLVDDCPACFALPSGHEVEQKIVANNKEIGLTFNGLHCFLSFEFPLENDFRE